LVKNELLDLRGRHLFSTKLLGEEAATGITGVFLEKNTFHFLDTKWSVREYLNTAFPCGYRPRDYVRDIVVYIRCENFLGRDGSERNVGGDGGHLPEEEDYECFGHGF
jgi:hypothetical protein